MIHRHALPPRWFVATLCALSICITLPAWYLLATRWPLWEDYILRALLLSESSKQIWGGDIYPRWLLDVNAGYGSPVMLFQPMLPHYIGALFEPLARIDPHGFGRLLLCFPVFYLIGSIGCYTWLRNHFSARQSRVGTVFLAYYCWYLPLLAHSTVMLAIGIAPWLLHVAYKLGGCPWRNVPLYAILQSALYLSSLPFTIVFSAIPAAYALVMAPQHQRWHVLVAVLTAEMLGLSLSAGYWLPATLNRPFIMYSRYLGGIKDYNTWFDVVTSTSFGTYITMLFVGSAPMLLLLSRPTAHGNARQSATALRFFIAVSLVSLFMCLPPSRPIWNAFPPLQNLQFPYRFRYAQFYSGVFMIAYFADNRRLRLLFYAGAIAAFVVVFAFNTNSRFSPFPGQSRLNAIANKMVAQDEVHTKWMVGSGIRGILSLPPRFMIAPDMQLSYGAATITNAGTDARGVRFSANVTSDIAVVLLRRFYYPGWVVKSGPSGVRVGVIDARVAVMLPKGVYDVQLAQPWFPGEKMGGALTAAATTIVGIIWLVNRRGRCRFGHSEAT